MAKYKISVDAMLEQIMPVFNKTIAEDLDRIKKAIETSDFGELKAVGHKIKGNAGGYGFDQLGEMARSLEAFSVEANIVKVKETYEKMTDYVNNVEVEYIEE